MTEKLYYKDIETHQFQARVLETVKEKKSWKVVLDKTCFYPEGGGQPADKGHINQIPVTNVQKENDKIYHYLPKDPGSETVTAVIDTAWRHDYMQQHTGQHIISGALWKTGGYKTVSVHMGADYTTIEIESPDISESHLLETEKTANNIINQNLPIKAVWTNHKEIHTFPLRKPSTHEGNIRLVQIGDFDCVGCGGLHLPETRLVELVKAVGVEKIRGNTRIAWKIGQRAFDDYREKDTIISQLKPLLATREDRFVKRTLEIIEELSDTRRKYGHMENRLADTLSESLYQNRHRPEGSPVHIITASWNEEDSRLIKKILKNLFKLENLLICFVNIFPDRVLWSIGCSEGLDFPFENVKAELFKLIEGKGGGRAPLWQGTGLNPAGAADFLEMFKTLAANRHAAGPAC